MTSKKIISICLCFVLIIMTFSSCKVSNDDSQKKIAVIVKSEDSDFWDCVKGGVYSAATEYNVSVSFEGPENEEDYDAQNEMIDKAIEDGVDAIVLSAINYTNSVEQVNLAAKKGIKIVAIDSAVDSAMVSLFIGTDNFEAGQAAGSAVINGFTGDEKIYIGLVNYSEGTDNGQQREQGFKQYISQFPNAEIVSTVNVSCNVDSATAGALTLLKESPQINVLVGFNEWMTLGIGNAVKQTGASDDVMCVGFDTNVVSIGMLETGEMDALIVQNPFAIGYLGIKSAFELVSGQIAQAGDIYTSVTTVTGENLFDDDIQKILFRFK